LTGPTGPTGLTGPTGATGAAGVVSATAPITYNSGTQTVALNIGSSLTTSSSNLIVDSTVVPYLANANTFTAQQVITPATSVTGLIVNAAASSIGLVVKANATTPGNLTEWQSSAAALLARITSTGVIETGQYVNMTTAANAGIAVGGLYRIVFGTSGVGTQVSSSGASNIVLITKGATSQSGDYFQVQNSAATVLAKIDSSGNLYAPTLQSTTASTATLTTNGDTGGLLIGTVATGNKGLVINGITSQTANLQEWQVAGSAVANMSSSGRLNVAQLGSTASGKAIITVASDNNAFLLSTAAAGNTGLIIRGIASQTGDLLQFEDSTTTINLRVNSAGQIQAPQPAKQGLVVKAATTLTATITNAVGNGTTVTYTATNTFTAGQTVTITGVTPSAYNLTSVTIATASSSQFTVTNAATGTYVSGGTATVAQSANLQEWQDTAGTVLGKIDATGNITLSGSSGQVNLAVGTNGNSQLTTYGIGAFGGGANGNIQLYSRATTATRVGFVAYGATSQTADLLQTQTSAGVNFAIGANGVIANGNGTATQGAPTIASAATIAPVNPIVFVSGTTTINTITAPAPISTYGGSIKIIPTGAFATGTSGNIAIASTAVVSKMLEMTYDVQSAKWYPSYV
jgi:hypothetical protein